MTAQRNPFFCWVLSKQICRFLYLFLLLWICLSYKSQKIKDIPCISGISIINIGKIGEFTPSPVPWKGMDPVLLSLHKSTNPNNTDPALARISKQSKWRESFTHIGEDTCNLPKIRLHASFVATMTECPFLYFSLICRFFWLYRLYKIAYRSNRIWDPAKIL